MHFYAMQHLIIRGNPQFAQGLGSGSTCMTAVECAQACCAPLSPILSPFPGTSGSPQCAGSQAWVNWTCVNWPVYNIFLNIISPKHDNNRNSLSQQTSVKLWKSQKQLLRKNTETQYPVHCCFTLNALPVFLVCCEHVYTEL